MFDKLGIYIPSRGRNHIIDKGSIAQLPKNVKIYTVVPSTEKQGYEETVPDNITVLPTEATGIANVRQWILENAKEPYVLYVSDDVQFSHRNEEGKLKTSEKKHVKRMLKELCDLLDDGYVHVGVSQRAFNHVTTEEYMDVIRMNDVYAYRKDEVLESGARFDALPVMEDFDITLTLLELGFPNRVLYNYAWSQRKSGEQGGCSLYRTWKMQRDTAFALAKRHPGCVRIVVKKSKEKWESVGTNRVDVNINWKKAYRPKRKINSNEGIRRFFNK